MLKIYKTIFVIFLFLLFSLWGCGGYKKQAYSRESPDLKSIKSIPYACKDPRGSFTPVTHILSKGSYNSDPKSYKPIADKKGFITEDFNKDKFTDYIFIERSAKEIQLVICISHNYRMSRKIPPFKVHETIEPDFQTISESIKFSDGVLTLSLFKHEHNWGSDTQISTYTFNNAINDFVLNTHELSSTSGDGMRSDTYDFFDLVNRKYKTSNTCGGLEEGCKSYKREGKIKVTKYPSTLFNPYKIERQ